MYTYVAKYMVSLITKSLYIGSSTVISYRDSRDSSDSSYWCALPISWSLYEETTKHTLLGLYQSFPKYGHLPTGNEQQGSQRCPLYVFHKM